MFDSIEDIEYNYCLDFKENIKYEYNNDIIKIFNNELNDYSNYENNHPEINIILAIYNNCMGLYNKAISILINMPNNSRALCTLGVIYKCCNDDINSIEYLKKSADLDNKDAINNLAYEYFLMSNEEMFHKYNNLNTIEARLINLAIFELNIKNNTIIGEKYITEALKYNNHRAYYIYAALFIKNKNSYEFYEYLFRSIKLKMKKQYMEYLINYSIPEVRFLLCHIYDFPIEIFSKYDKSILTIKSDNSIVKNIRCPMCLTKNELNIKLKCHHSFCKLCFIQYKKCMLCVKS